MSTPRLWSSNYLLTVDPGLLTGVALIDTSTPGEAIQQQSHELDIVDFEDWLEETLYARRGQVQVVVENYIISESTAKKTAQPWSLREIGVVAFLCRRSENKMLLQVPSDITELTSDDLRTAGFWHKSSKDHGRDALKHAVVYLKNRDRRWARRFL